MSKLKVMKDVFTASGRVRASVKRLIQEGQLILVRKDDLDQYTRRGKKVIAIPAELQAYVHKVHMAERGSTGCKMCDVRLKDGRRVYVVWDGRKNDAGLPQLYTRNKTRPNRRLELNEYDTKLLAHIVNTLVK